MAPDKEKIRPSTTEERAVVLLGEDTNTSATTSTTTSNDRNNKKIVSLRNLRSNEVCIRGVIYDLDTPGFVHPGGTAIHLFGGSDATEAYHMIHPHHSTSTGNNGNNGNNSKLDKYLHRVGTVADYTPVYTFDSPFARDLKRRVFREVPRGREFATAGWFCRAILYCAAFLYCQYLWIFRGSSWTLAIIYGTVAASIGLNVQHDANHGAAAVLLKQHKRSSSENDNNEESKPRYVTFFNDLFGFGADWLGGSKWLWMEQHWTHHCYTNDRERDPDTFAAQPMVLFNPPPLPAAVPGAVGGSAADQQQQPGGGWFIHRFQVLYFLPVLAGYWISQLAQPGLLNLQHPGVERRGDAQYASPFVRRRIAVAWAIRLAYLLANAVPPFVHHGFTRKAMGHLHLYGAAGSLVLGILFTLSHNFDGVDREPTTSGSGSTTTTATRANNSSDGNDDNPDVVCWYKSQVETSCTYGGTVSGWLTGGLNYQIEHHLFPRMSSAWYPTIAPAVRKVCQEHNVNYVYYPWVWQNLLSTFRYVHDVGQQRQVQVRPTAAAAAQQQQQSSSSSSRVAAAAVATKKEL